MAFIENDVVAGEAVEDDVANEADESGGDDTVQAEATSERST